MVTTKEVGEAAETLALRYLQRQGLVLLARNYRTPGGRSRRGGEIDLVMQDPSGSLVFVEVRHRRSQASTSAAESLSRTKLRRVVFAAEHYLLKHHPRQAPPCRFDVIAQDGEELQWLRAAFDGSV